MTGKRKAAQRPEPRTVSHTIQDGLYAGWSATMRADWPAGWMQAIEAGDLDGIMGVLDKAIVEHNMPDATGDVAERMADVDPADGMATMAAGLFDELGKLPNR